MSFYIGLLLKNKVIIAADRRIFNPKTNIQEDSFDKIGKISEFVYFSGAGNMPFGMRLFKLLKDNSAMFIDEISKIRTDDIKRIYSEEIARAREEITDFDNLKDAKGYLNVDIMLGGFNKQRKPMLCYTSNVANFKFSSTGNYLSIIHPNMPSPIIGLIGRIINMMRQQIKDLDGDNQVSITTKHLSTLFEEISVRDSSVSAICDILILDFNGNSTRAVFNKK